VLVRLCYYLVTPNWRRAVHNSINHKRYDPIGFWENRHSYSFEFTRWLFVLKYVHKEYTMNCLYFQYVLYAFKILGSWSCFVLCIKLFSSMLTQSEIRLVLAFLEVKKVYLINNNK
jgi:hypothetical protein